MHTRQPDSERVTSARSLSVPASANAEAAREQNLLSVAAYFVIAAALL
jgi:hypothetical protein